MASRRSRPLPSDAVTVPVKTFHVRSAASSSSSSSSSGGTRGGHDGGSTLSLMHRPRQQAARQTSRQHTSPSDGSKDLDDDEDTARAHHQTANVLALAQWLGQHDVVPSSITRHPTQVTQMSHTRAALTIGDRFRWQIEAHPCPNKDHEHHRIVTSLKPSSSSSRQEQPFVHVACMHRSWTVPRLLTALGVQIKAKPAPHALPALPMMLSIPRLPPPPRHWSCHFTMSPPIPAYARMVQQLEAACGSAPLLNSQSPLRLALVHLDRTQLDTLILHSSIKSRDAAAAATAVSNSWLLLAQSAAAGSMRRIASPPHPTLTVSRLVSDRHLWFVADARSADTNTQMVLAAKDARGAYRVSASSELRVHGATGMRIATIVSPTSKAPPTGFRILRPRPLDLVSNSHWRVDTFAVELLVTLPAAPPPSAVAPPSVGAPLASLLSSSSSSSSSMMRTDDHAWFALPTGGPCPVLVHSQFDSGAGLRPDFYVDADDNLFLRLQSTGPLRAQRLSCSYTVMSCAATMSLPTALLPAAALTDSLGSVWDEKDDAQDRAAHDRDEWVRVRDCVRRGWRQSVPAILAGEHPLDALATTAAAIRNCRVARWSTGWTLEWLCRGTWITIPWPSLGTPARVSSKGVSLTGAPFAATGSGLSLPRDWNDWVAHSAFPYLQHLLPLLLRATATMTK